jgi:type I restriction enzyme M protein
MSENPKPKDGYLFDFISGQEIKATPEEVEAVQVYSKILVEDYEYPKEVLQTRPQFRVKVRPSDVKKEYPIDIAVFENNKKNEDDIRIIVECKKKTRKDGLGQLQDYLRFSKATLGVWFNGDEKLFIRKLEKNGKVLFQEIPNIPKYKQRLEDVGKFLRKDLKPALNLKSNFKTIRNYLAANNVGATRDEVLAQELINIIFCKIYDEKFTRQEDIVTFRAGIDEEPENVSKRIINLFTEVKKKYSDVLDSSDSINLDSKSIYYVVGELQNFSLTDSSRDAIGDAFEVFIDHALKGGQGQFFTPRNVVKMVIDIVDPTTEEKILDPACGSGGFLIESMRYIWSKIEDEGKQLNWPENEIEIEKQKIAIKNLRGIDKDSFLSKVAKAYMALLGDGRGGVFCENSLDAPKNWHKKTQLEIKFESFDVVVTNPPFGAKLPVTGEEIIKQFQFGYKWKFNKKEKNWEKGKIKEKEAPQILFIERCMQLLTPGGRLGIVLPDGILGNDKLGYIRDYLIKRAKILAVIDVPIETFMPHTSTKTSVIIIQKYDEDEIPDDDYEVFMAIADTCGHNRRGDLMPDDDIALIPELYKKWKNGK